MAVPSVWPRQEARTPPSGASVAGGCAGAVTASRLRVIFTFGRAAARADNGQQWPPSTPCARPAALAIIYSY